MHNFANKKENTEGDISDKYDIFRHIFGNRRFRALFYNAWVRSITCLLHFPVISNRQSIGKQASNYKAYFKIYNPILLGSYYNRYNSHSPLLNFTTFHAQL